jgi:hypothetical protein
VGRCEIQWKKRKEKRKEKEKEKEKVEKPKKKGNLTHSVQFHGKKKTTRH